MKKIKTVEVGCAIIAKQGRILIAQRKPGTHLGGYWEFPGGKKEAGETLEECLAREVYEELRIRIRPRQFLRRSEYEYPDKKVILYFYLCDWIEGDPVCEDCHDFKWVRLEEFKNFRFPPGDEEMLAELIRKRTNYFGESERI